MKNIPENKKKDQEPKDEGSVLANAYKFVDDELAKHVDATVSGTTAVTCLIENNHLWIANSGDSRAIVVRKSNNGGPFKSIDLTIDHKPDSPGRDEAHSSDGRPRDTGEHSLRPRPHFLPPPRDSSFPPARPVSPLIVFRQIPGVAALQAGANGSPARVWHNLRGLAMARSIGDHAAATVGVIAEPEITECAAAPALALASAPIRLSPHTSSSAHTPRHAPSAVARRDFCAGTTSLTTTWPL